MKAVYRSIVSILLLTGFIQPALSDTHLNGIASYSDLGKEVFLGALYLEQPDGDRSAILTNSDKKRIEVRLVSRLSKRRWVSQWMQSIAINNSRDAFEIEVNNLVNLFDAFKGSLEPGDTVSVHYSPAHGTAVSLNNTLLATGQSKNLFNLFLRAWIGPVPPSTEFRAAILGTGDHTDLIARLKAIKPTSARTKAIASWVQPEPEPAPEPEPVQEQAVVVEPEPEPKPEPEPLPEPVPVFEEDTVEISVESLLAQQDYTTAVIGKIYKALKYPRMAVRRNQQGSVRLNLQINRDGSIASLSFAQKAKYVSLNKAAQKAVTQAAPFDPVPGAIQDEAMIITVPIAFRLTD